MIASTPQSGPRWRLADWLELEVLRNGATASVYAINSDGIDSDVEITDSSDEDAMLEERILRLTVEIERRKSVLGDHYPFEMSADGRELRRRSTTTTGQTVYLFCLLASHGRADGFLQDSPTLDMKRVPDLFQVCATWSAAGFVGGPAFAVGYDPTSGTFLQKLARIYTAFGDGLPHTTIPVGAPRQVKDDGIDVIAWQTMPDSRAPADYVMAQVASGQHWRDKTVIANITKFLNTWFVTQPTRKARPAMIIPHCLDAGPFEDQDTEQQALATHWARLVGEFGEVLYRYLIPTYAQRGIDLASQGISVELAERIDEVETFVNNTIAALAA